MGFKINEDKTKYVLVNTQKMICGKMVNGSVQYRAGNKF